MSEDPVVVRDGEPVVRDGEPAARALLRAVRVQRPRSVALVLHLLLCGPTDRAVTTREACRIVADRDALPADRETVRKDEIRPLVELRILEKVTRDKAGRVVTVGHATPNSSRNSYRLAMPFVRAATTGADVDRRAFLEASAEARRRAREAELLGGGHAAAGGTHEALMDACESWYVPSRLPGYRRVYRDPPEGARIHLHHMLTLAAARLEMDDRGDPNPDILLWDPSTDGLWIIEAVTSEGPVDERRRAQVLAWLARQGMADRPVGFTTAFCDWATAARFMGRVAAGTHVWVRDDPLHETTRACLDQMR